MGKMMTIDCRKYMLLALPLLCLILFAQDALALANQTGPGLPGEQALETFRRFVLGPVGFTLSLLGIVALGIAMYQGGDMQGMMRGSVWTLIGVGFVLGAAQVLMLLFPGATISEEEAVLLLQIMGAKE